MLFFQSSSEAPNAVRECILVETIYAPENIAPKAFELLSPIAIELSIQTWRVKEADKDYRY